MGIREALFQTRRRSRSPADFATFLMRMAQYTWIALLKRTTVIPLTFGAKTFLMKIQPLGPREGSRGIFVFRKQYEPLLTYGSRFAHAGDVVLDLGANQGIFCCAFGAAVGPTGRVIAVEPIPRQTERLRANIALNGFDHCEVVQKAISDRVGTATLSIDYGDTAASIMAKDPGISIEVETTSVDEIVSQFGLRRVDFIKIDVEGAEKLALLGATNTLRKYRPALSLEAANPVLLQEIRDLIKDLGYRLFVFKKQGCLSKIAQISALEDNVIALAQSDQIQQMGLA